MTTVDDEGALDLPDMHPKEVDLTGPKEARLERGSNFVLIVVAGMTTVTLVATIVVMVLAIAGSDDLTAANEGRQIDNARAACRLQIEQADIIDRRAERNLSLNLSRSLVTLTESGGDPEALGDYRALADDLIEQNIESLDEYESAVESYLDAVASDDQAVLEECAEDR